ncbi:unnamed protein product [Nesidiocoris tenuis]|uniref:Uncharacterized protein n=1 Tax=Nesidiocoris tenuis TaxID=355587 RepID=A0A6H5G0I7_9HEMI|nr:unnamed protein product [Nesidiocoris tenuis]
MKSNFDKFQTQANYHGFENIGNGVSRTGNSSLGEHDFHFFGTVTKICKYGSKNEISYVIVSKTIRLINDEPAETAQSDVSRSIYPQTEKKLRHDHPKPAHRTHEENEANFREDRHCEHCSLRESRIEKICNALRKFFRFLDRPIATIFWSVVDFLIPENRRRGGREDTRDEDEHGEHETHHEEEQEEIHDAGRQYAQNNPSPIGETSRSPAARCIVRCEFGPLRCSPGKRIFKHPVMKQLLNRAERAKALEIASVQNSTRRFTMPLMRWSSPQNQLKSVSPVSRGHQRPMSTSPSKRTDAKYYGALQMKDRSSAGESRQRNVPQTIRDGNGSWMQDHQTRCWLLQ